MNTWVCKHASVNVHCRISKREELFLAFSFDVICFAFNFFRRDPFEDDRRVSGAKV